MYDEDCDYCYDGCELCNDCEFRNQCNFWKSQDKDDQCVKRSKKQ
jgi:hypothetical protein